MNKERERKGLKGIGKRGEDGKGKGIERDREEVLRRKGKGRGIKEILEWFKLC